MNGGYQLKKRSRHDPHDAVFKLRKILGTKKIGHGGTLGSGWSGASDCRRKSDPDG